ncbi:MAG: histone deacetylase [Longimicrobiales bacterium]|nr:histone deacetylase [Longimicrobiales bacterium]
MTESVPSSPGRSLTGFLLHPAAALHDPGWGHPEHQGRLRGLVSAVGKDMLTLHERVAQIEPRSATEEEVLRVHTREHLHRVRDLSDRAMEEDRSIPLDSDTLVSGASWDAALGSSGAVLTAVEGIAKGTIRNAFVGTRPPGHHAGPSRSMGFCLFNHVAVAARFVQDQGLGERVLIVDWDVHHGNGTQEVFYEDGNVFYLSLHQFPHYPGTGPPDETGKGAGVGTTLNVALPPGTSRVEYRERFQEALAEVRGRFDPDFVFVSSGFDVLKGDPLGGQELEPEDLHGLTREVMALAEERAGERLVVLLEGGYVAERVGSGTVAVLRALAGLEVPGGEA